MTARCRDGSFCSLDARPDAAARRQMANSPLIDMLSASPSKPDANGGGVLAINLVHLLGVDRFATIYGMAPPSRFSMQTIVWLASTLVLSERPCRRINLAITKEADRLSICVSGNSRRRHGYSAQHPPIGHACDFNGVGERFRHRPWGIFGGPSGAHGAFTIKNDDGTNPKPCRRRRRA